MTDLSASRESEEQAAVLAVRLGLSAALSHESSTRVEASLPALRRLEADYNDAWRATLVSCGLGEGPAVTPPSEALRQTLEALARERANKAEAAERAEMALVIDAPHQRRQAVRQRGRPPLSKHKQSAKPSARPSAKPNAKPSAKPNAKPVAKPSGATRSRGRSRGERAERGRPKKSMNREAPLETADPP